MARVGLIGADADFFQIVGTSLYLKAGVALHFESKSSYAVAVTVDDTATAITPDLLSSTFTLNIANVSGVEINGTSRNDTINATATVAGQPFPTNEEDIIRGGAGSDNIAALAGNDIIDGGTGADLMRGGLGNDTYSVDNKRDRVIESHGEGIDTVQSALSYALTAHVENLTLTGSKTISGTGNELSNVINGNAVGNTLFGLQGADTLNGGAGNDRVIGGGGADQLIGGLGRDKFVFVSLADSSPAAPDMIIDFIHGTDIIDLSSLDANALARGNQTFKFGGHSESVVSNQVTWNEVGGNTIIRADVNGDLSADFAIVLIGTNLHLAQTDFLL